MKNNALYRIFAGKVGIIITVIVVVTAIISCVFAVSAALLVTAKVEEAKSSALTYAKSAISGNDLTEAITETAAEAVTEAATKATTEAVTESVTEAITEAVTEPIIATAVENIAEKATSKVTEQATEPITEPITEAQTEPVTEPITEAQTEPVTEPEEDKYIICLDAGHGFDDPGTDCELFGSWSEKNITLDIVLRVGRILTAAADRSPLPMEVYYTRTQNTLSKNDPRNVNDYYVLNPYMREDYINTLGTVDAIVSVHCDSYEHDGSIDGARIFYCKGASDFGSSLAVSVRDGIFGAVGAAHSGKEPDVQWLPYDDAYYITKCTAYPSILIETGFVTNKYDAANMMDHEWRQKMADGIAAGILSFLGIE